MNQLIDNLAVEAGFVWREGGSLTQGHTIEDVERFAKLIIKECLETIEMSDLQLTKRDIGGIYLVVKQHFGAFK